MLSSVDCLRLRLPHIFTPYQCRPISSLRITQRPPLRPSSSPLYTAGDLRSRKWNARHDSFSSSAPHFIQQEAKPEKPLPSTERSSQNDKRKTTRSKAAKNSLRRVAVEAQRSKDGKGLKKAPAVAHQATKVGHSLNIFRRLRLSTCYCIDRDSNLRCRRIRHRRSGSHISGSGQYLGPL